MHSSAHATHTFAPRAALTLVALALAGCATSAGLVNMWKDPEYPTAPLRKVYVIAVKKDPARRRITEDAFVAALTKRGLAATPSYRDFSDALPDTQQAEAALKEGGFDGLIVASRLDKQNVTSYVPGYTTTESYVQWNPYRLRYDTYYREVYREAYTETDEVVRHRVDVWSYEGGGRLVWTGTTQSVNPSSSEDINREMVNKVIPELAKKGILPAK